MPPNTCHFSFSSAASSLLSSKAAAWNRSAQDHRIIASAFRKRPAMKRWSDEAEVTERAAYMETQCWEKDLDIENCPGLIAMPQGSLSQTKRNKFQLPLGKAQMWLIYKNVKVFLCILGTTYVMSMICQCQVVHLCCRLLLFHLGSIPHPPAPFCLLEPGQGFTRPLATLRRVDSVSILCLEIDSELWMQSVD